MKKRFRFGVVFFLACFGIFGGSFFVMRDAQAFDSASSESAYRAVETALKEILSKMESNADDDPLVSAANADDSCFGGVLRGKNVFGEYSIIFFDNSKSKLSCSDQISSVVSLTGTGFSGGETITVSVRVPSRVTNRCFGSRPDFTVGYSGDDTGLAESVLWQYAAVNTDRKCEYACRTNYTWNGTACIGSGTNPVDGSCGSAARDYTASATAFSGAFCSLGSPSPSEPAFPSAGSSVSWNCLGEGGGSDASCSANRSSGSGDSCSVYTENSTVANGYGPPFDMLSSGKKPTLTISCESTRARATAGNTELGTYVYKRGFVAENNVWKSISFSGTPSISNDGWFSGTATSSDLPLPGSGERNFVLAFICRYQGTVWKCGCRDSACAQNYWTIQGYEQ